MANANGNGQAGRWRVLITADLPDAVRALFAEAFDITLCPFAEARSRAEGHDALIVTVTDRADAAFFSTLPASVKAVATYSVGTDHIDLAAAQKSGRPFLNTPDVLTRAVAEATMLLILGAARRTTESVDLLRSGQWTGWKPTQLVGIEIGGRTLGIFGMGRIGQSVAARARAFEMRIAYHSRNRLPAEAERGADYCATVDDLLAVSDVLLLAAPATPDTLHFLNRTRIAQMRDGAVVVNIARGSLVDDDALIAALQSGKLRAAGLDVFNNEPKLDPRYLALPNAFLLPHIGSSTIEARLGMAQALIDGFNALRAGRRPSNQVA